jgi:hypothetical protein
MSCLFIALLAALNLLAMKFGYDSRIPPDSKEYDLAGWGMTWN